MLDHGESDQAAPVGGWEGGAEVAQDGDVHPDQQRERQDAHHDAVDADD